MNTIHVELNEKLNEEELQKKFDEAVESDYTLRLLFEVPLDVSDYEKDKFIKVFGSYIHRAHSEKVKDLLPESVISQMEVQVLIRQAGEFLRTAIEKLDVDPKIILDITHAFFMSVFRDKETILPFLIAYLNAYVKNASIEVTRMNEKKSEHNFKKPRAEA